MSPVRAGLTGVIIALWRALRNSRGVLMRTSHCLLSNWRHRSTLVPTWMKANGNFSDASLERLHSLRKSCVISPSDAADLESPLSVGIQVSVLQPFWIAMIISCWNVKLLKLPSVTLTNVCGTNSNNRQV